MYINNDFLVTFTVNESIEGATLRIGYIGPSGAKQYATPSEVDVLTKTVHFLVTKLMNTQPGTWRFWLESTNGDQLVADSTEVKVEVKKH